MNRKLALAVLGLGLAAALAACEDEVIPPPPELPPQIETVASYGKTTDDSGRPNGLPSTDVYCFLTVSNGEFWVGTAAGIAKYPNVSATTLGSDDVVNEINGLPHPRVTALAEHDGKVYASTWGGGLGVYDIAGDAWTQIRAKVNGLRSDFVADIAVSPAEGLVYFATSNEVSIYAPVAGTFTSFTGTIDPLVSCVEVVDNGGTIERWYGPRLDERVDDTQLPLHGITVSKGPSTVFTYTTANSGLVEPNVNDIFFDSVRGVFWVAYSTKGLAEVNVTAKTWTAHTYVQGLPSSTVYSVARAGDTVWAATQNGLARLGADGRWQGYNTSGGLQADRVRRLYSDDGQRLWLGFIQGGAARVKAD